MKVVINKCHGGFSLSPKATELYYAKKGKKCYFFTGELVGNEFVYTLCKQYPDRSFWHASEVDDPKTCVDVDNYLVNRPENRADPDLISVVEELGEEANGSCAKLSIIEVPDDVKWHIEEYDGMEHVAENHRTWH